MTDPRQCVRKEVAAALPTVIRRTLSAYLGFTARSLAAAEPEQDVKQFAAHQAACKTAAGHLDLLLRLHRAVTPEAGDAGGGEGDGQARAAHLESLVQEARAAVEDGGREP